MIADTIAVVAPHTHDGDYDAFIQRINDRFKDIQGPIFQTDATGLYANYLASFPEGAERQYHTCSCCEQFIDRFGGLATVADDGSLVPAVWNVSDLVPDNYMPAVVALERLVRRANITMPFLSSETMYGTPVSTVRATGHVWHHFAIQPAAERVYRGTALKNAYQAACEKREDVSTVVLALQEYSEATVTQALTLLKADTLLPNAQAVVGQAQFLADLHAARGTVPAGASGARLNLTWRAVATAPAGFCHPRSSMIATLLDDIQAGKTFEQAKAAWSAKMHPLAYQRPQAAPTAGAIAAAERDFEKMGYAPSLKRRYARLEDILETLWEPKAQPKPASAAGGIFASVKAKGAKAQPASMQAPAQVMTWDKFQRTVLPTADMIEVFASTLNASYAALTTAVDPDAPPILQWDRVERRNPVALYLWNGGSSSSQFGLEAGMFHKVNAITLRPSQWFGGGFEHQSVGAILIIDGAQDSRSGAGSALFPVTLKSELHGMRSVIEAYSRGNELEGRDEASACGLLIGKEGTGTPPRLRVTSAGQTAEYKIDRWD